MIQDLHIKTNLQTGKIQLIDLRGKVIKIGAEIKSDNNIGGVGTATGLAIDLSNINNAGKQRINKIVGESELGINVKNIYDVIGLYSDREPITIEEAQAGKAIVPISPNSRYGRVASMDGASLSKEYSLTRGDLLKIKAGKTGNDIFTIARVNTSADGSKTYSRVVSLNAMAELPQDGYLYFLVMPSDMKVVVTFFAVEPTFSNQILVKRCGIFASISSQVGDIYTELTENYMRVDGYSALARVGIADALANMGEGVEYEEILTAGRMMNNAPDLTSRDPHATDGVSTITMASVAGVSCGGNQMVNKENLSNGATFNGIVYTINKTDGTIKVEGTSTARSNYGILRTRIPYKQGHKILLMGCPPKGSAQTYYLGSVGYRDSEYTESGQIDAGSGCIVTAKNAATNIYQIEIIGAQTAGQSISNTFRPSWCDLTTLFPLDPTFVTSLNKGDVIKVAHRLGFFSYEAPLADLTSITQLENRTIGKMAEVLAKLGYQEPRLCYGSWGRINALDGKTGAVKQSINAIDVKSLAWQKALGILEERGIDIPDFARVSIEFGVNKNACVQEDEKGITISAWMVDLGSLNWARNASASSGIYRFAAKLNSLKESVNPSKVANILALEYTTVRAEDTWNAVNMSISDNPGYSQVVIVNNAYTDVSAFKTSVQGQYLIYELAEPIRVEYDEVQSFTLANVQPYDLLTMDDMEGTPLYKVDINVVDKEGVPYQVTDIYPNPEWVEAHHQLPVSVFATMKGIGTSANYSLIMNMLQRIIALESK